MLAALVLPVGQAQRLRFAAIAIVADRFLGVGQRGRPEYVTTLHANYLGTMRRTWKEDRKDTRHQGPSWTSCVGQPRGRSARRPAACAAARSKMCKRLAKPASGVKR